jgi:hypothetical protein
MTRRGFASALAIAVLLASGAALAQPYPPGAEVEIIAPRRPPPPRRELIPPPHAAEALAWEPGHWHWERRREAWVWIPGRYLERPHRLAVWEQGHWAPRRDAWVWVPGHWREG